MYLVGRYMAAMHSLQGPSSKVERSEGMCVSRPSYCLFSHSTHDRWCLQRHIFRQQTFLLANLVYNQKLHSAYNDLVKPSRCAVACPVTAAATRHKVLCNCFSCYSARVEAIMCDVRKDKAGYPCDTHMLRDLASWPDGQFARTSARLDGDTKHVHVVIHVTLYCMHGGFGVGTISVVTVSKQHC